MMRTGRRHAQTLVVIPAKAGISAAVRTGPFRREVPACAGTTVFVDRSLTKGVLA